MVGTDGAGSRAAGTLAPCAAQRGLAEGQATTAAAEAAAERRSSRASARMAAAAPMTALFKQARLSPGLTCLACRKAKVPCSATYPCARCFKRCLKCELPAQLPVRRGRGRRGGVLQAQQQTAVPIELAFSRFNGKECGHILAQAFLELQAEGRILRPQLVAGLQFWRYRSLFCGHDVTCGAAAIMAANANPPVTALELEGMQALLTDTPEEAMRAFLAADIERLKQSEAELKASEFFKHVDDAPATKCLFTTVFDSHGRIFEGGNALFEDRFLSTTQFLEESLENKTVNTVLFGALIAPEDRILWFRTALEVCMTNQARALHFIKIFDRAGEIHLYLVESAQTALPGSTAIIGGVVTRLELVPPSRHVTALPGFQDRVQSHRNVAGATVPAQAQPLEKPHLQKPPASKAALPVRTTAAARRASSPSSPLLTTTMEEDQGIGPLPGVAAIPAPPAVAAAALAEIDVAAAEAVLGLEKHYQSLSASGSSGRKGRRGGSSGGKGLVVSPPEPAPLLPLLQQQQVAGAAAQAARPPTGAGAREAGSGSGSGHDLLLESPTDILDGADPLAMDDIWGTGSPLPMESPLGVPSPGLLQPPPNPQSTEEAAMWASVLDAMDAESR